MTRKKNSSASHKRGRPTKLGPAQCAHCNDRQPLYNGKRDDRKTTQRIMSEFLDSETVLFFSVFGWVNPLRSFNHINVEPSAEDISARKAEAEEARKQAKSDAGSDVHKKRDKLVKYVRTLLAQRFANKYAGRDKKATVMPNNTAAPANSSGSGSDILKLLFKFLERPSPKHLCKVWANSQPGFEAEVDRRLPEVRSEKGNPNYARIGLWNTMARCGYEESSEAEKEQTFRKAQDMLEREMKSWRAGLALPETIEEGISFMVTAQPFLEELMQFFADRCGGMAVMILAGSGNVVLSQGTCDIAGKPKILYGDIEGERPLLRGLAQRVHTQACLVSGKPRITYSLTKVEHQSESRWGVSLARRAPSTPCHVEANKDTSATEGTQDTPLPSLISPYAAASITPIHLEDDDGEEGDDCDATVAIGVATSRPHKATALTVSPAVESVDDSVRLQFDGDDAGLADESYLGPMWSGIDIVADEACSVARETESARATVDVNAVWVNTDASAEAWPGVEASSGAHVVVVDEHEPPHPPRPRPKARRHATRTDPAAPTSPVSTSSDTVQSGMGIEINAAPLTGRTAPLACMTEKPNCITASGDSVVNSFDAGRVDEDANTPVPRPTGIAQENRPSIFTFQQSTRHSLSSDEAAYTRGVAKDGAELERRKPWFAGRGMTAFFLAVPQKLKERVNLEVAFDMVRAYLTFESSNAAEGTLNVRRYVANGQPQPEYVASLQQKSIAKITRVTWSKMAQPGMRRMPAELDVDVGVSLAQQWIHQQPDARRTGDGRLSNEAHTEMNWEKRLTPGPLGVRLLVQTLLCWGSKIDTEARLERVEWEKLARDFADVMALLACQAGPYEMPATDEGATDVGKRIK
ncbi:unnamed protein product [Peniophora sp. CBMAI 1063]|nr:unnamed protein product [Peniophora sp. CBMAI 1063]